MPATEFSLEHLLAPITIREFYDKYWEKAHLYIPRQDASYYGSLLSFADVDRLIFFARESPKDLVTIVPPPGSKRPQARHRVSELSMDQLYNAFNSGDTIRVSSVQDHWLDLSHLATRFGETLGVHININLYMTPANSQAFPVHFDTHDGFIMQMDGSKQWSIYEPYYELPVEKLHYVKSATQTGASRGKPEEELRLIQQIEFKTGDVLYIPRGVPHKAVATSEPSLHLTVGVHPLCWVDFLKAALEVVSTEEVGLRRSLPPGFAKDPEVQKQMPAVFQSLLEKALGKAPFERTFELLSKAVLNGKTYPPDGYFADVAHLADLGSRSPTTTARCTSPAITSGGLVPLHPPWSTSGTTNASSSAICRAWSARPRLP
jgi:ribosomal protein L16 Arg81 hydroxylase